MTFIRWNIRAEATALEILKWDWRDHLRVHSFSRQWMRRTNTNKEEGKSRHHAYIWVLTYRHTQLWATHISWDKTERGIIIVHIYSMEIEEIWHLCPLSDVLQPWQKQPDDENCSEKMVQLSTSPAKTQSKNTWDHVIKHVARADVYSIP